MFHIIYDSPYVWRNEKKVLFSDKDEVKAVKQLKKLVNQHKEMIKEGSVKIYMTYSRSKLLYLR